MKNILKEDYVWCDKNHKYYTLQEIDDRYLLNILNFISKGGGYVEEMDEISIKKLFNEANKRKLKHNFKLKDLIDAYNEKYEFYNYWSWLDFCD